MVTAGSAVFVVLATVVKLHFHPAVKDAWFQDGNGLAQAPAGLVIVRPTHFERASGKVRHVHDGDSLARTAGRNVSFRDLLAEAYDCSPGQVVLPPGTPQNGFDFLVTRSPHPRQYLRAAIEKQFGCTAMSEIRNTDVLVLKVKNAALPGLAVSADGETDDVNYRNGKLYFQHQPLSVLFKGLENGLKQPVMDQTGLTNYYDFSLVWGRGVDQAMRRGTFNLAAVNTVFNGWGLELQPDTASMEMFVVKKAY